MAGIKTLHGKIIDHKVQFKLKSVRKQNGPIPLLVSPCKTIHNLLKINLISMHCGGCHQRLIIFHQVREQVQTGT